MEDIEESKTVTEETEQEKREYVSSAIGTLLSILPLDELIRIYDRLAALPVYRQFADEARQEKMPQAP